MKPLLSLLVATMLSGCATTGETSRKTMSFEYNLTTAYAAQTPQVKHDCFPDELKIIIAHIKSRTGTQPIVTSGHRPNARRKGSYHRHCDAADIRVPGIGEAEIVAAAESAPGIGGIGTYCNGLVHVDTGPSRRWRYC